MNKKGRLVLSLAAGFFLIGAVSYRYYAAAPEPASADDPLVALSYLDGEVTKLQSQINDLKTKVTALQAAPAPTPPSSSASYGTVTASSLYVRKSAVTGSIVGVLPKNAKVQILSESSGWYNIKYNSLTGWASGKYIKK